MKTNAEIYFEEKMQNPEFRALYTLSKEKIILEFMLEKLIENKGRTMIRFRKNGICLF